MIHSAYNKLQLSVIPPVMFVAILWLIMFSQSLFDLNLSVLGVMPLSLKGLVGIITAPLVHGSFSHLFSNSVPLIMLGTMIFYFYPTQAVRVITLVYIFSGLLLWFIGRDTAYHIGASGLVYGFATFLIFSGFFRKDVRSLAIALLIVFFYGGMVWGLLPLQAEVSWEAHIAGALVGLFCAVLFKNLDMPDQPKFDDDEDYEHLNYKSIVRGEVIQLDEKTEQNEERQ